MESGGDKNKEFLRWIRALPSDRRKDELQRIVSGGVLNGTSAKSALFKLQRRCFVKLRRLDIVRGMMAGATACSSAAPIAPAVAAPTPDLPPSPSPLPCPSASPSPSSPPLKPKRLPGASRPCPLSRKRPSDTVREEDSKRSRGCSEAPSADCPKIDLQSYPQPAEPSLPCAVSDQPKVPLYLPQPKEARSSDLPQTKESQSSGHSITKEALSLGLEKSNEAQSAGLYPPDRKSSHVSQSENPQKLRNSQSNPPKPAPPHAEPSKQLPTKHLATPQSQLPHQRVSLSSRVIEVALNDVAKSIHDVETELFNIDQKLISFEKLPPSHKTSRTISALSETSSLIFIKAGVIKSCVERGIVDSLSSSFFPKLLSEVNKIPQLKLYSRLRLMAMVNLLLNLANPNNDPNYTIRAFMAQNLVELRPAENNMASKPSKQPAPSVPAATSRPQVTSIQVSSMSQATNLPPCIEAVSYPGRNVEVTPQQPQHVMQQAAAPHPTTLMQQQEQQRQYQFYREEQRKRQQEEQFLKRQQEEQWKRRREEQRLKLEREEQRLKLELEEQRLKRELEEQQHKQQQDMQRLKRQQEELLAQRQQAYQQQQYIQQQQLHQQQQQNQLYQQQRHHQQYLQQLQQQKQQHQLQQQPKQHQLQQHSQQHQLQQHSQQHQLQQHSQQHQLQQQSQQYIRTYGPAVRHLSVVQQQTTLLGNPAQQQSTKHPTQNNSGSAAQMQQSAQHSNAANPMQGVPNQVYQYQAASSDPLPAMSTPGFNLKTLLLSSSATQVYYSPAQPTLQSVPGSALAYDTPNHQLPREQQGFPRDNRGETTPQVFMAGQEYAQGGIEYVNQVSPVARTLSRDSGIATPEPAATQCDDTYLRSAASAAAWKPNY
ncbi:protein split ends-like [Thrips palmi]|uniref:Protein split ends-like n=1 Tax=Thrips palmi TaxID=161013 RepID=A0A6P8YW76_THRPL|nr:protein split ends-like [Thrips palmi]